MFLLYKDMINLKQKFNWNSFMTKVSYLRHQLIDPINTLNFTKSMIDKYIKYDINKFEAN